MSLILNEILYKSVSGQKIHENELNNLSSKEIGQLFKRVKNSRIEEIFLQSLIEKDIVNIGSYAIKPIQLHSKKRYLRTLENIRYGLLISNELKKKNIRHCFLKGLALIFKCDLDPKLRGISDIDILIQEEDIKPLFDILLKLDFDLKVWSNVDFKKLTFFRNPTIKHKFSSAQIDIHFIVLTNLNDSVFENHCLFNNTNEKQSALPVYSTEDLFIHLLYHGTIHNSYNVGPVFFYDLILLLNSGKVDWEVAYKKVIKYKLEKELSSVMSVCKEFTDLPNNLEEKIIFFDRETINDLKKVFIAPPNSSSALSYKAKKNKKLHYIFKKLFAKESYLDHSHQKTTIILFLNHLFLLFRKHFLPLLNSKYQREIVKLKSKFME